MKFNVVDEKGKSIALGCDLTQLQQQLKGQVKETLSKVSKKGIEKSELLEWNFGKLPKSFTKDHGGYEVKAFPALVDKKKNVAIELFDSEQKAALVNRAGLRRLVLLNVPSPVKYLQQSLPNKAKLGLYFNPFGQVKDLIDDCIACAVDAILAGQKTPQTESEFSEQKEMVRAELADRGEAEREVEDQQHDQRKDEAGRETVESAPLQAQVLGRDQATGAQKADPGHGRTSPGVCVSTRAK